MSDWRRRLVNQLIVILVVFVLAVAGLVGVCACLVGDLSDLVRWPK